MLTSTTLDNKLERPQAMKLAKKVLITYGHHIIERGNSRSKAKDELALV